jgi:hypothetical protein
MVSDWQGPLINMRAAYDGVVERGYYSHTAALEAKDGF